MEIYIQVSHVFRTLQVHVHRRLVTVGHIEILQLGLDQAYGLQPQNRLAEAFGNVVSVIQVRSSRLHKRDGEISKK